MQVLIPLVLLSLFASCNNQSTTSENKDSTSQQSRDGKETKATLPDNDNTGKGSSCYMQVLVRDTFVATLQQNGAEITGRLSFDNFEKDGSSGPVRGRSDGDIIKLVYSFTSEGMNSIMDIYFKIEDDILIRGIGEMKMKGDTAYFADPASVTYPSSGSNMKKIACDAIPSKYK